MGDIERGRRKEGAGYAGWRKRRGSIYGKDVEDGSKEEHGRKQ